MKTLQVLLALLVVAACGDPASPDRSDDPTTPEPQPPYAVGSTTVFIHDESRAFDAVGGVQEGVRTLITEVWYPVEHDSLGPATRRATYGDYVFGDRAVHRTMMTATTFFHLTPDTVRAGVDAAEIDAAITALFERQRASHVDAPMARAGAPWPVLVMTHGDAGSRYNMESASEHLAAHGYVVIAPEHTGNSPYSQVGRDPLLTRGDLSPALAAHRDLVNRITDHHGVYGKRSQYGQSYAPLVSDVEPLTAMQKLDTALVERVNDLRAALTWLDGANSSGSWAGMLTLDRIGVLGRSFGGVTVLAALGLEPRFVAGFAVVPPVWPDERHALAPDVLVSGRESVILSRDEAYPMLELTRPTVLFSMAEDALIIGLAANGAQANGTGKPTPENPHPALRSAFMATDQPAVWALLANANHGSPATAGPYWWPDLKPRELPQTFDPAATYTLVEAERAHMIQKELARDFFDLFIKGDQAARARLEHNAHADAGLILETRNI